MFFKQKTAYEMRVSDWSSEVCSSDLRRARARAARISDGPDGGAQYRARAADPPVPSICKAGLPDAGPARSLTHAERGEPQCLDQQEQRGDPSASDLDAGHADDRAGRDGRSVVWGRSGWGRVGLGGGG